MLNRDNLNNLVRGTTFFQHSGIAITFVFMPIIASGVAESVFEIGIIVAAFAFAQILTETYFGRMSDRKAKRLLIHKSWLHFMCTYIRFTLFCR